MGDYQKRNIPFIIKKNFHQNMLPTDSSLYDERIEGYTRFVQSMCAFTTVSTIF